MTSTIFAGLMSGTSMDGVDAVLVDLGQAQPQLLGHHQLAYPAELLQSLQQASRGAALTASQWLDLDHQVAAQFGLAIAALLTTTQIQPDQVAAVGSHGQTVWHQPDGDHPNSWQLGNPSVIAAQTGIPVVADFRRMDIALGGQGAPLAPAFHAAVFAHPQADRTILNLGGIANITVLNPTSEITGYDTGPANCLLDCHYRKVFDQPYDKNGDWAATGQVNTDLLDAMLADSYFAADAPKSTGLEYFSWGWVTHYLQQHDCRDADLQATLTELSVQTIAAEITKAGSTEVYACGGGVNNTYLMQRLAQALPENCRLATTAEQGLDPQQVEAMAFAWFAQQRLAGKPANLPSVTGASSPCLLGSIYQA